MTTDRGWSVAQDCNDGQPRLKDGRCRDARPVKTFTLLGLERGRFLGQGLARAAGFFGGLRACWRGRLGVGGAVGRWCGVLSRAVVALRVPAVALGVAVPCCPWCGLAAALLVGVSLRCCCCAPAGPSLSLGRFWGCFVGFFPLIFLGFPICGFFAGVQKLHFTVISWTKNV